MRAPVTAYVHAQVPAPTRAPIARVRTELCDQPGVERVRREVRATRHEVTTGRALHLSDHVRIETGLEPTLGGRDCVQSGLLRLAVELSRSTAEVLVRERPAGEEPAVTAQLLRLDVPTVERGGLR